MVHYSYLLWASTNQYEAQNLLEKSWKATSYEMMSWIITSLSTFMAHVSPHLKYETSLRKRVQMTYDLVESTGKYSKDPSS